MGTGEVADATITRDEATSPTRASGFSLVAVGALCGMIGVSAVLFAQGSGGMQRYVYREVAGGALSLALLLFLAGASWSLPLGTVSRILAIAGGTLGLAGVGAFIVLYPTHWNVPGRDYSAIPISVYGTGLAFSVAAVTNGLLRAYVEWRTLRRAEGDEGDDVTDEEVMLDILETTGRNKLTWGGVRGEDRAIQLHTLTEGLRMSGNVDLLIGQHATINESVDGDVTKLLSFRGVRKAETEEYDDSPVTALAKLRAEQRAIAERTWIDKLRAWWTGA